MPLHRAAYLDILEEIRKDLPWLIQIWLSVKGGKDATVQTIDVNTAQPVTQAKLPL